MADTLATLTAGERSLILKLQTPTDWNNTKVRNDLSAVKIWISTTSGFTPGDGNLIFNGPPAASITIPGLTPSTTYYVKYAFISSIQPDVYTYSQQYSATVNAENVNTATAYAYQWGTTQPSVDSTTGTYTWATAGITSFPSGWSATVPAVPGTGYSLYRLGKKLAATASTQTSSIAWNTGTVENISYIGINGIQTAYVYAYYWANTTPSINSTSAIYTWSTGEISARPTSPVTWTATPSTGGLGSTLYEAALKIQAIAGDTQTSVNWSNATISTVGYNGTNGVNAITGFLNNQTATVPANSAGTVSTFVNAVSTMYVYVGSTDDSANWTYTKEDGTGITSTISGRTVTVTGLSSDTGYITITASRSGYTSIPQIFTVTKAKTGVAGNDATAYWLTNSIAAIQRNINGSYSPTTITVYGYSATGTNGPALYAGRFKIYEDGSLKYTSSGNESSSTYTPSSASISNFKVELYLAGGTTTKIDEQIIPVVSDGATGATGAQTHRAYYAGTSTQPSTPGNTTSGAAPSGWSLSPVTVDSTNNTQWQSDGFTTAGSTTTTWSTPYLSYFKVANLSAISADLGTVTAGSITGTSLTVGTSPAVSGTTMTGSGGKINTNGTFALGNSSTNITFNGTTMYLNGDVIAGGNIKGNAVTTDKIAPGSTNEITFAKGTGFRYFEATSNETKTILTTGILSCTSEDVIGITASIWFKPRTVTTETGQVPSRVGFIVNRIGTSSGTTEIYINTFDPPNAYPYYEYPPYVITIADLPPQTESVYYVLQCYMAYNGALMNTTGNVWTRNLIAVNYKRANIGTPSYVFSSTPGSINEGSTGTFEITTNNVADGTTLYYVVNGSPNDFTYSGTPPVQGSFTIYDSIGTFTLTPFADQQTEGVETFTVNIKTGSITGTTVATSASVTINDTSLTAGSSGGGSGGGGGGCPDPATPILISPTISVQAGSLKSGDMIWTMHETTKQFDMYQIINAELVQQPRLRIEFSDYSTIVVSESHRFLMFDNTWQTANTLNPENIVQTVNSNKIITSIMSIGIGNVVKLEVMDAHTYISAGIISHNVKAGGVQ